MPSTRHRVAAVGRDVQVQHGVIELQIGAQRSSDRRVRGQFEDAFGVLRQAQLPAPSTACRSIPRRAASPLDLEAPGQASPRPSRARSSGRRAHWARRTRSAAARRCRVVTWHTRSLSACGCGSALMISATTTPVNGGAAGSAPRARSRPWSAARRARRRAHGSFTHSLSQPIGDFHALNAGNCSRKRRSLSKNSRMSFTP